MPSPMTLKAALTALPYVLRMGLATLLFSSGMGLLVHALARQSLLGSMVYSLCIGLFCWALIDGTRLLGARLLLRLRPQHQQARHGWPGWALMLPSLLLLVPLAYVLGSRLGARLLGLGSVAHSPLQGHWGELLIPLLVPLLASVVATGFFYTRGRLTVAKTEMEQARRLAAETQLRLLQAQLEPHMLFNTLANLRVLIALDPPRAQGMLDRLIAFLRATLSASRSGEAHALKDEFARLADYLALMQLRMGPQRLRTRLELPAELADLPIPPLLLQPLAENAIQHGLEPQVEGGELLIRAGREEGQLQLTLCDSGCGPSMTAAAAGTGFGLAQVRERLAIHYGERAGLSLEAAPGGGTLVRLWLPIEKKAH